MTANHTDTPRRTFGTIRKLPSGKYQARYVAPDGKRHQAPTIFQTKGDANAYLSIMETKIITGKWKPTEDDQATRKITFATYAEAWLADRELKPRTRQEYRILLDQRILPTFGDRKLITITAADIRSWHAHQGSQHPTARAHATRCYGRSWVRQSRTS